MIDVSTRLRRAIILNDLALVARILRIHPAHLQNPDFTDKSNTSLHLAAKHGLVEISEYLIHAGHEDKGVSRNNDGDTPLMLSCEAKQIEVGQVLITQFPRCVPCTNNAGMDALMICSRSGALPLLSMLLTCNPPASPTAHDNDGNTALHHASAAGELKALRMLLHYGASPMAQNNYSWTPVAYSSTAAAEAYFKQLIAEFEKRRLDGMKQEQGRQQRNGGVRLVTQDQDGSPGGQPQYRPREDSLSNLQQQAPSLDWSANERRAMTPTELRNASNTSWPSFGRTRASSGE